MIDSVEVLARRIALVWCALSLASATSVSCAFKLVAFAAPALRALTPIASEIEHRVRVRSRSQQRAHLVHTDP